MIELTDQNPKEETPEQIKARKHEEFFQKNKDRLLAFHEAYPKSPPPVRWDESAGEWRWVKFNREMRRSGIILTDAPVKIVKP